jgi:chromate transporter
MAIHLGFIRAGWAGLVVAGVCFILPAVLITAGLAWAYVKFGSLPQVAPFFYGIKPAVLAVILAAALRLGRTAVKGWRLGVVGVGVVVASLGGVNEVLALFVGGALGMLWLRLPTLSPQQRAWILATLAGSATLGAAPAAGTAVPVSLWKVGAFFLKVGAVLYGSGYVLVAFLEGGLVHDYAWLTRQQLLDAVAIGQFTPGPVLSTATFVGYLVAGAPGAWVATAAIFLPSFCFVAALNPFVPRLRRSPWTAAFLDAVNVSSIALMAAVTLKLAQSTLTAWPAWLIAAGAAALGVGWKVDPSRLILGGAVAGWALSRWGS